MRRPAPVSAHLRTPITLRDRHGVATSQAPSVRPRLLRAPTARARSTTGSPDETTAPLSPPLQRRPNANLPDARERAHDRGRPVESDRTGREASLEAERPGDGIRT